MAYREARKRSAAVLLPQIPQDAKSYLLTSPFLPDCLPEGFTIKPVESIDTLILKDHDIIVVSSDFPLDEATRTHLAGNLNTPVIYCSPSARPMPRDEELSATYNLFDIVPQQIGRQQLEEAFKAKDAIAAFILRGGDRAEEILKHMPNPSVRRAAKLALEYIQSEDARLRSRVDKHAVLLHWTSIVHDTLEYHREKDPALKKALGDRVAPEAEKLLQMVSRTTLEGIIRYLGDGLVGEDPVAEILDLQDKEINQWIYRHVLPSKTNSAAEIARQRAADAQWLLATKHPLKTSIILDPVCFEAHSTVPEDSPRKNTAFLLMRYIEGQPLWQALETLNEGYANPRLARHARRTNQLRYALVRQYVDACVEWCKNPPPIPDHFKRPTEPQLHEQYSGGVAELMDNWRTHVGPSFTETDTALYHESTKLFRRIKTYEKGIVRVVDSGFGNRLITPNREWTAKELIDTFATGNKKRTVDHDKLRQASRQVDIQRKYGHVLEDLAQIVTFYEARFLLYNTGAEIKNRFSRGKIESVFYTERDRFLDAIGWKDSPLKDDNLSYVSLLTYRAVRKLNLFFRYWRDSCTALLEGQISDDAFEHREKTYPENMRHYALLGRLFCFEATDLMKPERGSRTAESRKMLDLPHHQYARAHPQANGEILLDAILDPSRSPAEVDLLRTYALRGILTRMDNCFKEAASRKKDILVRYKS